MTLEEMIEWSEISAAVSYVVNALEECSTCHRITECESLCYLDGHFCKQCIGEFALIRISELRSHEFTAWRSRSTKRDG